jgi:drug/metabolite transporter (DMT)-like permease
MALPPHQPNPSGGMTSRDVMLGVGWGLGAALCHSFVPIGVRMLSDHIPTVELVFFRNLIGLVFLVCILSWRGFGSLRTSRIKAHFVRNTLNFAGMWLWFTGLSLLPLSTAVALHFTLPLMVVILAMLFLGERPSATRIVCTIIGFGGVLVILRPGTVSIGGAAFLVLASALCYAGVGIFTRVLGRTEAPATTTFYYQAMVAGFALIPTMFVWVTPSLEDIPAMLLLAAAGTAAPYCLVRGLVHAEVTIVEPLEYLRLPFTATLAWLIFNEATDPWTWLGAVIIALSTWYMTRHAHKAAG